MFPLDHFHECDASKTRYLECLARRERDATACATLSKAYLECRMARELMAREDLTQLGFRSEHARSSAARARDDGEGGERGKNGRRGAARRRVARREIATRNEASA